MRSADHFDPHAVLSIFVLLPHIDASIFLYAILEHPEAMFLLLCERPSFIHTSKSIIVFSCMYSCFIYMCILVAG